MSQSVNKGIIKSWSLMAFAAEFGPKLQVGEFANSENGEVFNSCIFTHRVTGDRTFVSFSSKMGELTPKQIAAQKDSLQVVQLSSGNYSLCPIGEHTWQDVDLGIAI